MLTIDRTPNKPSSWNVSKPRRVGPIVTVYTPIVDHSLLQDHPLKIQIEDPSKINQWK